MAGEQGDDEKGLSEAIQRVLSARARSIPEPERSAALARDLPELQRLLGRWASAWMGSTEWLGELAEDWLARHLQLLEPGELSGATLASVDLAYICGFASATLHFGGAGWHVVLGDNGSGKSTLLRAIAVAMLRTEASAVAQPWARWLRSGASEGLIEVHLALPVDARSWRLNQQIWLDGGPRAEGTASPSVLLREAGGGLGLFFAGFGPFRRFDAGADASFERGAAQPAVAPVLSLFDPGLALRAPLLWLRSLRILELQAASEGAPSTAAQKLAAVKTLLNHGGLLPAGVRFIDIRAEPLTARFDDGQGGVLALEALSDGYRSVLSLVMELLRLMDEHFGDALLAEVRPERAWVDQPGIVLIDEVDAHLHPSWQQEIGASLTRVFPKVQFIVTTHSPLVARAATGSVHHLRAPEGDEVGTQVEAITGVELDRLRWGGVLEALEGPAFDVPTAGQSPAGLAKLERLATLRQARRRRALSPEEEAELQHLDAVFLPTEGL